MAINICSDKPSLGISPRISFSHDPKIVDAEEHSISAFGSSSDFVFCVSNGVAQKLSSADELFSNGKIVPTTQITRASSIPNAAQQHNQYQRQHHQQPLSTYPKKMLKEFLSEPHDDEVVGFGQEQTPSYKFFWRSSSVNCDGATRGKRLLSFSLQFLSRSYSTGSAPTTPKHITRESNSLERHRLQKQSSGSSLSFSSSSSASSTAYYFYDSCQKPSLKKKFGSVSSNGVRISPILNLPHQKAIKSIFRIGSLFCRGKSKRKK